VLDSLEALLAMDYRVLRADRPEAGLAILGQEPVAVIVSDQRMPGMTGTEFLARSRDLVPEAVRILLTAFTDADALMESINAANIYHFLLKPWDPTELTHTVRRGVERLHRHDAAQAIRLEAWLARVRDAFAGRILPITVPIAEEWGRINVPDPLPIFDGLLVATARVHGLTLVTRNISDLQRRGMPVLNPWAAG